MPRSDHVYGWKRLIIFDLDGVIPYFAPEHICTHDVVEQVEASLRRRGEQRLLSKPHPFPFWQRDDQPLPWRFQAVRNLASRGVTSMTQAWPFSALWA
jgi:hypothetical protein